MPIGKNESPASSQATPDRNQVSLFDPNNGQRILVSQEGSLVKNLCRLSKACKGKGPVTVRRTFTKEDAREFLESYRNGRRTSVQRENDYADRMDSGAWITDWPTHSIDWDGNPVNGGHTSEAFLKSKLDAMPFVIVLGADPKISVLIDTGKVRSSVDQMGYITGLSTVKDMTDSNGSVDHYAQQNFATSVSYLFSFLAAKSKEGEDAIWPDVGWTTGKAKKHCMEHPRGQQLARALLPMFTEIREIVAKALSEADEDGLDAQVKFLEGLKKAQFYVPALMLYSTGKAEHRTWIRKLVTGRGISDADVHLQNARAELERICRKSLENGRRDSDEVLHDIFSLLSHLYAKDTNTDRFKVPPRWGSYEQYLRLCKRNKVKPDPEVKPSKNQQWAEIRIWQANSKEDVADYNRFRPSVCRHFLGNMR